MWTATIIGVGIVIVFAFAEYTPIGNYNYITPYSHEAMHGLMISVFTLALLSEWIKRGKIWTAAAAGFCAGIVFLTKPDIFMALAVAIIGAFVLFCAKFGRQSFLKALAAFVPAGIVPSLFFIAYFLREENFHDSVRSVVFGWLPLLHGTVTKSPFYQWCLGLDKPADHLKEVFVYFAAIVFVVAIYIFLLRLIRKLQRRELQYAASLLLALPLLYWATKFSWIQCGWPLPLLSLTAFILIAWNYQKLEPMPVFPLLWSLFSLVVLAKLGLFPRIWHYGFVLAMPAFVSSIYLLFWLLPLLLERKLSVPAGPFRMIVGLVLIIGFTCLMNGSQSIYAQKTLSAGKGGDQILTYNLNTQKSQAIFAALEWTREYMPSNATLAVLPEGVTLNYLTRHANSTPCLDWNPTMFTVFGQERMTDAVEKNPPDYIFVVEWDSSDFGVGYFGSSADYGLGLMQWIQKSYKTELLIGNEPLKNGLFGIKILKHVPPAPTSPTD